MNKKARGIILIFLLTFIVLGCSTNNNKDKDTEENGDIVKFKKESIDLTGFKDISSLKADVNNDGKDENILLVSNSDALPHKKVYLIIKDSNEVETLYTMSIDNISTEVIDAKDTTGDGIKDILIKSSENGDVSDTESYLMYTYRDGLYEISEKASNEFANLERGFLKDYNYYVMDTKTMHYVKASIPEENRKDYVSAGYLNQTGYPKHKVDNFYKIIKPSQLIDLDGDDICELVDNSYITGITDDQVTLNLTEVYKYQEGKFQLISLQSDQKPIVKADYSTITIEEVKDKIYEITGNTKEKVDYNNTEEDLNLPENIKSDFYRFYELYNDGSGGVQSDSLIIVNKKTLVMYRYYVDGKVLPL